MIDRRLIAWQKTNDCGEYICRHCEKPVKPEEEVIGHGYWTALKFVYHKSCRDAGQKEEAYSCQTIDADCSDCKHFQRGDQIKHRVIDRVENGVPIMKDVSFGIFNGHCLKFNKPTTAKSKTATLMPCFEHRKSQPTNQND